MGSTKLCVRIFQSFSSLAESSTKMAEESRWMLILLAKEKGKTKGCFVCGRPGHAAKDCRFNQGKGKGQANGKGKGAPDKNSPAKFEGECRHCGKKGHKWADCRKRLAEAKNKKLHAVRTEEAPSTATVAAVDDTGEFDGESELDDDADIPKACVFSVENKDMATDAEFTCPLSFSAGGHDLEPSSVQLRNANGLSTPSGRRVLVSYNILGPGGRPFLSVGTLTTSGTEAKFGSKSSWIDLHTDNAVQRVPVRVKGKTFGLSVQKTIAWIIPQAEDAVPHAEVAPVDEEDENEE